VAWFGFIAGKGFSAFLLHPLSASRGGRGKRKERAEGWKSPNHRQRSALLEAAIPFFPLPPH